MKPGIAGVERRTGTPAHCAGGLFGWKEDRAAVASREVSQLPGSWRLESDDEWGMWFIGEEGGLSYILIFLDGRWMGVDLNIGERAIDGPWKETAQAAWDALRQQASVEILSQTACANEASGY